MLTKETFNKKLEEITFLWNRKDFDGALGVVDDIVLNGDPKMQAQGQFFGGMILKDKGLPENARQFWLDAIPKATNQSYILYLLQYNIGFSFQDEGLTEKAAFWYRSALQTCVTGDEFSGDQALTSLLLLLGGQIPKDDEALVIDAIEKSWRVLELPGMSDLTDIPNAIAKLNEGFSNLLAKTLEET